MPVAFATLYRQSLALLDEPMGSTVGEVPDTDQSAERTTEQTVVDAMNMAQDWLCRRCVPLIDRGTFTPAEGVGAIDMDSFAAVRHGRLWCVENVFWGVKPMRRVSRETLQLFDPTYRVKSASAPTHWYEETGSEVCLYPAPTVVRSVLAMGLALPKRIVVSSPATGQTATPDFIQDDLLTELLPTLTAIVLGKKMFDDPSVFGRLAHLTRQAGERCLSLWSALPDSTRAARYPAPPDVEGIGL